MKLIAYALVFIGAVVLVACGLDLAGVWDATAAAAGALDSISD